MTQLFYVADVSLIVAEFFHIAYDELLKHLFTTLLMHLNDFCFKTQRRSHDLLQVQSKIIVEVSQLYR